MIHHFKGSSEYIKKIHVVEHSGGAVSLNMQLSVNYPAKLTHILKFWATYLSFISFNASCVYMKKKGVVEHSSGAVSLKVQLIANYPR